MTAEKNDLGLKETKPAIILITCDQLNRNTLGCYGGKTIQTPHIDRLAGEGSGCHSRKGNLSAAAATR